jgi:hypothetical protein
MKDRGYPSSQKVITEIYLTANEPQSLLKEFSRSTKILDAEYKPAILVHYATNYACRSILKWYR